MPALAFEDLCLTLLDGAAALTLDEFLERGAHERGARPGTRLPRGQLIEELQRRFVDGHSNSLHIRHYIAIIRFHAVALALRTEIFDDSRSVASAAARPLLDRSELENGLAIFISPHRLLRPDEGIDGENTAGTVRELDLDALGADLVVAAHAQDLAGAVELPTVGLQVSDSGTGTMGVCALAFELEEPAEALIDDVHEPAGHHADEFLEVGSIDRRDL